MFELYLGSLLSGFVEALTGKAVEGLEEVARRAWERKEATPLEQVLQALRAAVDEARQEVLAEYRDGDGGASRAAATLLDEPPFAREVARWLVYRGRRELTGLQDLYLERSGGGEGAAGRWAAIEIPLAFLLDALESRLLVDPTVGPLLRDVQKLARLQSLEDSARLVAETTRRLEALAERSAGGGERREALLGELVALARSDHAHLGDLVRLLASLLEEGPRPAAGHRRAAPRLLTAEVAYLRLLREECDRLPLAEEPRADSERTAERASLAQVYIDLATDEPPALERIFDRLALPQATRREIEKALSGKAGRKGRRPAASRAISSPEDLAAGFAGAGRGGEHPLRRWVEDEEALKAALGPVTVLEAVAEHRHLVLLGGPGSGKSTFANHLAGTLAAGLVGDDPGGSQALGGSFAEPLFPIRVLLRRWSKSLAAGATPGIERVYEAIAEHAPGIPQERWLERLAEGGTLVVFDGLDEVPAGDAPGAPDPDFDRRRVVLDSLAAFRTAHGECRILVTCRVKSYEREVYQLPSVPVARLAPLDEPRIRRFAHLWYRERDRLRPLAPQEGEELRERLLRALGRPELLEMAGNPLLLTMLARVNARSGLPEGRAQLYQECVEQLLWEWERAKAIEGGVESLATLLDEPAPRVERRTFERALWDLALALHAESGTETATLPAWRLKEALAALHPARRKAGGWADRVVALIEDRGGLLVADEPGVLKFPHKSFQEYLAARGLAEREDAPRRARGFAESDAWREVVLLAAGSLAAYAPHHTVVSLVTELVAGAPPSDREAWRRILVAAEAWRALGAQRVRGEAAAELDARLKALLTGRMQDAGVPARERLEAGLLAADLGALPEDLDAWVEIPADTLPYGFRIGKYPVTNAQYQRFVEAGGYDPEAPWWSEEARAAILEFEKYHGSGGWPEGPHWAHEPRFNRATQPVVGVSWYEAVAFCAWLTRELRDRAAIAAEEAVRLSTVAEWARAAGGADARQYPWIGAFEANRLNCKEASLGGPSPVHMYPAGATPEGVFDLAGNVCEWIEDRYTEDRKSRVLDGGFWSMTGEHCGAAARNGIHPGARFNYIGFRVVVVPSSRA